MSYDLEVRSDEHYSKSVALAQMASIIAALPGVRGIGATSFVREDRPAGIHVYIDLAQDSGFEESRDGQRGEINSIGLSVPYPLLDRSSPVAVDLAFQMAEHLGWTVFDPQSDTTLSRESSAAALRRQASARDAGVEGSPGGAEPSLVVLFAQEMWNHSLVAAALLLIAVAAGGAWVMLTLGWSKARMDTYLPWVLAGGGVAALWGKSLVQATLRWRALRRELR
jgi:hypothetical protein